MGTQIQLAQAPADEREMIEWLKDKGRFLALPRLFQERKPTPVDLGQCKARELIFFPESVSKTLLGLVIPCEGVDGTFLIEPSERAGLVIEWLRTARPVKKAIELGGPSVRRLYFDPAPKPKGVSADMAKVTSQLFAYVRRSSPAKSDGKIPHYVGKHLLARVQKGEVQLVKPNGDPIKLVAVK